MKKYAILVAILTLGVVLGAVGALLYSTKLTARALLDVKSGELYRSYEVATEASKSQPAAVAIWALEQHLKLIDEFRKIGYSRRFLDVQAIIVHARLAKLYEGLGEVDKSRNEVDSALEVAKSSNSPGLAKITSKERLFVFLAGVDDPSKRDSKYWEE